MTSDELRETASDISELSVGHVQQQLWKAADTIERLQGDSRRWKHVEANHSRAHSPHMDGTFGWAFRGPVCGRFRTFTEAIDAAINSAEERT